jgi:hypothetical protein
VCKSPRVRRFRGGAIQQYMGADQPSETGKNKNKLQILWALIYWARSIRALYLAIASIYLHVGSVADHDPFPILSSNKGCKLHGRIRFRFAGEIPYHRLNIRGHEPIVDDRADLFHDRFRGAGGSCKPVEGVGLSIRITKLGHGRNLGKQRRALFGLRAQRPQFAFVDQWTEDTHPFKGRLNRAA